MDFLTHFRVSVHDNTVERKFLLYNNRSCVTNKEMRHKWTTTQVCYSSLHHDDHLRNKRIRRHSVSDECFFAPLRKAICHKKHWTFYWLTLHHRFHQKYKQAPLSVLGAKPPKCPTKLSNFRQTPPFALEKAVFSPLLGQNFRKFVIFREGGSRPLNSHAFGVSLTQFASLSRHV